VIDGAAAQWAPSVALWWADPVDPSVDRLAGQLGYLFDDEPALRNAPVEQLRNRLSREDRFSRARARYPMATDDEIAARVREFDDRITTADVESALARVRSDPSQD
jgi:hypothetical protein